jgi:Domain of Unknown Function (DUF1080)
MRCFPYALALFGAAVLLPIPLMSAGEFKLEPGFTLLFNGKNLDGWREKGAKTSLEGKTEAHKGRFKIAEGVLIYDPKVGGDKYIETTKEFAKDVHIKLDFKPGKGCNNDFFVRGAKFDIILAADEKKKNKENKNVKEGEWTTFEIIIVGDTVEHKIGGETARMSKAKTGAKATPLMLRAEFGSIEIKNIRVKE